MQGVPALSLEIAKPHPRICWCIVACSSRFYNAMAKLTSGKCQ